MCRSSSLTSDGRSNGANAVQPFFHGDQLERQQPDAGRMKDWLLRIYLSVSCLILLSKVNSYRADKGDRILRALFLWRAWRMLAKRLRPAKGKGECYGIRKSRNHHGEETLS